MTIETALFLGRFLQNPRRVGAVAPSSSRLAWRATVPVPDTGHPVVVELGPGTGAFTELIQRRLGGRGCHLALEVDPVFTALLRRRFPMVDVVAAAAEDLPDVLAAYGLPPADVVVSGLPWTVLPAALVDRTMAAIVAGMAPHGAFTTFAYLHASWTSPARRLRNRLTGVFEEVVAGRTVWANLPPALVYHARRPRHQSAGARHGRNCSSTSPSR
ncbi:class I SAM-dependent methyltransferase [Micromonospora sp. KC721]|uniref:class I SAM-dependent methyltransferase n=1 Tax=Micromonospora sp. KC721 TaxID=2530380 RepID=UPI001FB7C8CE|nr:SAM-dependent methyltransferase [Micromonospora sp. KC721]